MLNCLTDIFWRTVDFLQTYSGAVTAIATVFIAAFTIVLAIVSGRQARLTRQAIELANKEYISTHRPRIVLRDVRLIAETIHYALVNLGGTPATIVESWIFAEFVEDGTRIRLPWPLVEPNMHRLTFTGGASKDLQYGLPDGISFAIKWPEARRIGIDGKPPVFGKIYFVGAVVYTDDLGMRRRSIFRRRWDDSSLTFVRLTPEQERDHEYAD